MQKCQCEFCGFNALKNTSSPNNRITCPNCGDYLYAWGEYFDTVEEKNKIATYLFYNKNVKTIYHICKTEVETTEKTDSVVYVAYSEIESWYPNTLKEQTKMFLKMLNDKSEYRCKSITLHENTDSSIPFYPAFFTTIYQANALEQVNDFISHLVEKELIKGSNYSYSLTFKALENIDTQNSNSNTVFVAMSFAPSMRETKETIKKVIIENEFVPIIMNEYEHNNQIVPKMLNEIENAHFVIAELTNHNNGAYYEAGYALGKGKEVIYVCNKASFEEDGHFDVRQVNAILWETQDELYKKLDTRIKKTISK